MDKPLNNFSGQAEYYHKYRPEYPDELYTRVLNHVSNHDVCLDCATGNGQVAQVLSRSFREVQAIDISREQLDHAVSADNIYYSRQRAEDTRFEAGRFDLITVAQAIHWFNLSAFSEEVQRLAKEGSILAAWGYGLLRFEDSSNHLVDKFYYDILSTYRDPERKHLDHEYETIRFDFELIEFSKDLSIDLTWSLQDLEGYLRSCSAVQHYKKQYSDQDEGPVDEFIRHMSNFWEPDELKPVHFPLYLKIWRI